MKLNFLEMVIIERKSSLIEEYNRIPISNFDSNEASTSMPNQEEILTAFEEVLVNKIFLIEKTKYRNNKFQRDAKFGLLK